MTSEIQKHLGDEALDRVCAERHRQFTDLGLIEVVASDHAPAIHEMRQRHFVIVGDHPPEPRSH